MLIETVRRRLYETEKNNHIDTRQLAVEQLREVGLDDLGLILIGMPDPQYPKLSKLLPGMASEKVQKDWTGNTGVSLLIQTNTFIRFLATTFISLAKKDMRQVKVLDYGCGYGRMIRSLYYYVDPENITGVDPWDLSVEQCKTCGLKENIFLSDYLPLDLPVETRQFDIIYAFSVFTHLSKRAATQSLKTLRNFIATDGVLMITIRPIEYWQFDGHIPESRKLQLENDHRSSGFAFFPHNREAIDGDITYGDTSMTVEWIESNFPEWKVVLCDRPLNDPYQIYIALKPKT